MAPVHAFIKRHPVLTFYAVVFLLSWGGFLAIGGSGLISGTDWQTDPRFMSSVTAMLTGPPMAGLLLTALVYGTTGLRELLARLGKWRVSVRWYAIALLTTPLLLNLTLFALSLTSLRFLPSIFTAEDKLSLIWSGLGIGLVGGLVEELGWTGFAIPQLRQRYGVLTTGVIVGVLWGVWHLLQMVWVGRTSTGGLSPYFFLSIYFITSIVTLTAYRVLMVWVYDKTKSLLIATLMHASYIFSTLFVFAPPIIGWPFLIFSVTFAAVLWGLVAFVVVVDRTHRTQPPYQLNPL